MTLSERIQLRLDMEFDAIKNSGKEMPTDQQIDEMIDMAIKDVKKDKILYLQIPKSHSNVICEVICLAGSDTDWWNDLPKSQARTNGKIIDDFINQLNQPTP